MDADFLIIGGGIAGISAAARMSELGQVIVLEAEEARAELTNKQVPARQLITLIKQASADDLQKMAEGETRKQVLDAIEARRKQLEA